MNVNVKAGQSTWDSVKSSSTGLNSDIRRWESLVMKNNDLEKSITWKHFTGPVRVKLQSVAYKAYCEHESLIIFGRKAQTAVYEHGLGIISLWTTLHCMAVVARMVNVLKTT
jgi:hypothetical protein